MKGKDKIGTLTINQVDVTITMADRTLPYNGQTQNGWTRTDADKETVTGLVNNETVTIDYTPSSGKTAGTYTNGAYDTTTLSIKDGEKDVTENYNLTSATAGKLTIEPDKDKPIAVESKSQEWPYDADTHTYKTYTVTYGNETIEGTEGQVEFTLSSGDKLTVTPTEKGANGVKNVSDSGANSFTWTVENEYVKGKDKIGTLTITARQVKVNISGNTASVEYDTKEHTVEGYEVKIEDELYTEADIKFDGKAEATGTLVGEYPMGLAEDQFTNTNDNFEITFTVADGKLTITGNKIDPEKTTPDVTSNYKLGEEIPFTIAVHNVFQEAIENVTVKDPNAVIKAGEGYTVVSDHEATIAKIDSDKTVVVNAAHVVTEEDILAGTVENTATVTHDDTTIEVTGKTDKIDDPDTTLTIEKKITNKPANGESFALGETIEYSITATNKGNVPYTNVVLKDDLTGQTKTIAKLDVGKSESLTASYKVTEADILKGSVTNTATGKGDPIPDPKDPDTKKVPEGEDTVTTGDKDDPDNPPPIDKPNPVIGIRKIETSNATTRTVGGNANYSIVIANLGNVTLSDIDITDVMTVNGGQGEVLDVGVPSGLTLAPGEFYPLSTYSYRISALGTYVNRATASGSAPNGQNVSSWYQWTLRGINPQPVTPVTPVTPPAPPAPQGPVADALTIIDDFETPLGLGGVYTNLGNSFE